MATMVAVDLGAQSGRVALGRFDGGRLSVSEVHRFPNVPVRVRGTLYWDVLRLYHDVLAAVRAAAREAGGRVDSVGVDSWGVDFGLLDGAGRLVQNPVHHRDSRSARGMDFALGRVPARQLYERTGIQLMPINTVFQLAAMVAADDPGLRAAETLLLVPDLFHYWLTGAIGCEFTNASTTACLDMRSGAWALDLLTQLGIPSGLFPEVLPPGTVLGPLAADAAEETGLEEATVVAPATHDTGSAVAAVPFRGREGVYISAGTWSLVGLEVDRPRIDDRTFAANLTNEGGVGGTIRLLRNVTGLWLVHECRRTWAERGLDRGFDQLVAMAQDAPSLRSLVDPDDPSFAAPGDMPERIRAFCARSGQEPPETPGEVVRCALESIALGHARAIALHRRAAGADPPEVHVVGGGARNELLCQWTADATGLPVLAGPAEATAVGNLLVQALALGEVASLEEVREVVRSSFAPTLYEPREKEAWEEGRGRFERIAAAPQTSEPEAVSR